MGALSVLFGHMIRMRLLSGAECFSSFLNLRNSFCARTFAYVNVRDETKHVSALGALCV